MRNHAETQRMRWEKLKIALRYWLLGRSVSDPSWALVSSALEFALGKHKGQRKDGSPESIHQLEIAHYLRTLEGHMLFPQSSLICALLHDVREDYGVSHEEIQALFGAENAARVELLTKAFLGNKKTMAEYFGALAEDPCSSLAKGADRLHNHSSMGRAFSVEKQLSYLEETRARARAHILPMLKQARLNFPRQEGAYENIKIALTSQIELLEPALQKLAKAPQTPD